MRIAAVLAFAALVLAAPAHADRDVGLGIMLEWTAASGNPEGYEVWTSRNGAPFLLETRTPATAVGLGGVDAERIQVKVRAYRGALLGPDSPLSETFTFRAPVLPPGSSGRPTIGLSCEWGAPITTPTGPTTVRIECPPKP